MLRQQQKLKMCSQNGTEAKKKQAHKPEIIRRYKLEENGKNVEQCMYVWCLMCFDCICHRNNLLAFKSIYLIRVIYIILDEVDAPSQMPSTQHQNDMAEV